MRKQLTWTVDLKGRDHGKKFVITEMSAFAAESWALRVIMAIMRTNPDIQKGTESLGMAQLAAMAFKALSGLDYALAAPLLAEMLSCVKFMPHNGKPEVLREVMESQDDIEEVATLVSLRKQIFNLHVDFSIAAVQSLLRGTVASE